jgi:Stage II sporulation protein M
LHMRREALARAARRAVELVIGTAPVLVVAGLIEGFVSPSELPIVVKLAIGPLAGLALYSLLLTVGRGPTPSPSGRGRGEDSSLTLAPVRQSNPHPGSARPLPEGEA